MGLYTLYPCYSQESTPHVFSPFWLDWLFCASKQKVLIPQEFRVWQMSSMARKPCRWKMTEESSEEIGYVWPSWRTESSEGSRVTLTHDRTTKVPKLVWETCSSSVDRDITKQAKHIKLVLMNINCKDGHYKAEITLMIILYKCWGLDTNSPLFLGHEKLPPSPRTSQGGVPWLKVLGRCDLEEEAVLNATRSQMECMHGSSWVLV
jgi:hypothetical protein